MDVKDAASYTEAAKHIHHLIDKGSPSDAISFADACQGTPVLTQQLRALAYTDAGDHLDDREIMSKAIELWEQLGLEHPGIAYHLANAELATWDIAVRAGGYAAALEGSRAHLHRARELYAQVGDDTKIDDHLRVQALTNLANSLDGLGRDVDALDRYDQALSIDPTFGMALGNKATTLLGIIPLTNDHVPALVTEAATLLDAALADNERVQQIGGLSALQNFESHRQRISLGDNRTPSRPSRQWDDSYLAWCLEQRLFLHVSPDCLSPDTELLDPLFFRGMTVGLSEDEQDRLKLLVDAFDAIKQDYLAARYATWLAISPDSPVTQQASELAQRVKFFDSLNYARWGLRTGLALQAFTATINVLDKIASFVHLYLSIGRKAKVYFRSIWHPPSQKNRSDAMHAEIASQLQGAQFNRGLLALCDLSCDLEQDTPLNELVERRHAATHRFLVAHHMLVDSAREPNEWLERFEWNELVEGTLTQMRIARAALVYLARTVDRREDLRQEALKQEDGIVPTMPVWPVDPTLSEID